VIRVIVVSLPAALTPRCDAFLILDAIDGFTATVRCKAAAFLDFVLLECGSFDDSLTAALQYYVTLPLQTKEHP
jgi:hypothetical protein